MQAKNWGIYFSRNCSKCWYKHVKYHSVSSVLSLWALSFYCLHLLKLSWPVISSDRYSKIRIFVGVRILFILVLLMQYILTDCDCVCFKNGLIVQKAVESSGICFLLRWTVSLHLLFIYYYFLLRGKSVVGSRVWN